MYRAVLDIKFPAKYNPREPLLVVLRSFSSLRFENESQINITQDLEGHYSVIEYYVPSQSVSIDQQMNTLYFDDKLDPGQDPIELAKQFKVEVRTVDVSDTLLRGFFRELDKLRFPTIQRKPSQFVTLFVDGTYFQFTYMTINGELHFDYHSPEDEKGNVKPLGDWMIHLKKAIDSAPSATDGLDPDLVGKGRRFLPGFLSGEVVDSANKEVVSASITVEDLITHTRWPTVQSDSTGAFMIPNLPPGKYTVTVQGTHPRMKETRTVTIFSAHQSILTVKMKARTSN